MSLESNKWLDHLNEITEELNILLNEIDFDPELIEPEDETKLTKQEKLDFDYYQKLKQKKSTVKKKLAAALERKKLFQNSGNDSNSNNKKRGVCIR